MTINNITGGNSLHSNCQPDQCSSMLTNIHDFITEWKGQENPSLMDMEIDNPSLFDVERNFNTTSVFESQCDLPVKELNHSLTNTHSFTTTFISSKSPPANETLVNVEDVDYVNAMIVFDPEFETNVASNFDDQSAVSRIELISRESISYASSRICQKLFKFTKCEDCKTNFELMDEASAILSVERVLRSLNIIIPDICHQDSLKKQLMQRISSIQILFIGCEDYNDEIIHKTKILCVSLAIQTFSNNINSILSGKITTLPDNPNFIQKVAYTERIKKKRMGKYSDIYGEHDNNL